MNYRRVTIDRDNLAALLHALAPELPDDVRPVSAVIDCAGGLRLTIYHERFEPVGLVEHARRT